MKDAAVAGESGRGLPHSKTLREDGGGRLLFEDEEDEEEEKESDSKMVRFEF